MKSKKTSSLVWQNILLLIPLIIYSLYKNGYLIYQKRLIPFYLIFKSIYLVLISIGIKIIIDLIKDKKVKCDYDLLCVILIAMIMPYNINIYLYIICLTIFYILSKLITKKIKFNYVCLVYLLIILINTYFNNFSFKNPLEINYTFSFSFLDLLMGRSIGGIANTSIFFSLVAFLVLIFNFCYKKEITYVINLTYLGLSLIYYLLTGNNIFLNSEVIFGSIFISTLPMFSPYKKGWQIIYAFFIGLISFLLTIYYNSIISIYLATFIMSLFLNINKLINILIDKIRQNIQ